jgi:alpha-glucosidase
MTPWWQTAVIYQVYPKSFADSDGDGIGDLPGIRDRLPYLRDLGVDALWLSPFFRSPQVDGGYDVSDYCDVDPMFGTLADFDSLLATAHELDLRVIVDLVPNHSSSAHPWFVSALAATPGSPERDRYVFRGGRGSRGEQPPNDWESVFGGPAWTRTDDGDWYLHLFDPAQPDFNWRNLEVRAEFESILRFWLDRGVDGFRVDVAHGMAKADGLPDVGYSGQISLLGKAVLPYFDQDEVHDIYKSWRKILDSYPGERMAVAEAWATSPERLARYVAPDELHQVFNFDYLAADWSTSALRKVIDESLSTMDPVGAPATWVLSNHDKPRHVTRYGDIRRARAAILLMLALPGSAYVYQGEELGLPEVLDLPDEVLQDPVWRRSGFTDRGRDGCRVPLPWTGDEPSYGFGPAGCWLPQPAAWRELSVQAQLADAASMLHLYRTAIALRRGFSGGLEWLDGPPDTLVFRRSSGLVCAVNFGSAPVALPPGYGDVICSSVPVEDGLLPPDAAAWLT